MRRILHVLHRTDKVIDHKTGDDEANVSAPSSHGQGLFNLSSTSASLSYFSKIVDKGPGHRYHDRPQCWRRCHAPRSPPACWRRSAIPKHGAARWSGGATSLLSARRSTNQGNFKEGGAVQPGPLENEFFTRSQVPRRYDLRPKYDGKGARRLSGRSCQGHRKEADKTRESPSWRSVAGACSTHKQYRFDQYTTRLRLSAGWLRAVRASWAHFQIDGTPALGNIHTLNAPFFETSFS